MQKAGPYGAGLKVVEQYDCSRAFRLATEVPDSRHEGRRARPLQTLIWYPAWPGTAKPLAVGDYASLWNTETSYGKPKRSERANEWCAGMQAAWAMPLWAVRDAPEAPGRFPVVLYAPSFSSPSWENADLCEYLATHGYVVIASPSMGATTRAMTADLSGIDAQARDISFLIGYSQTLANTQMSAVAVMGYSWGGIANVFAAARDDRISALIALDGSMRYYPSLVKEAGDVHPEHLKIPLIYFAQGDAGFRNAGADVLDAWSHGDLIVAHMQALAHWQQSSMRQRNEEIWAAYEGQPLQKVGRERDDCIASYGWLARYTLEFLNAYVRQEASAQALMRASPHHAGVPERLMTVSYRAGFGVPVSFSSFRREIAKEGFERLGDLHAGMQKRCSNFELEESALKAWSEDLIDNERLSDAIALLHFNVQRHPESSDAYASLGRVYRFAGEKASAIENYRKALERNPDNWILQWTLRALQD